MTDRTHPGEVPGRGDWQGPRDRRGRRTGVGQAGGRPERRPALRCDGGVAGEGLFAATPDPAAVYVLVEGSPEITEVNDAYERTFDVDGGVSGPLEARLRSDLEREEPGEGLARIDDIVELAEAAAARNALRAVVRANTPRDERDFLARIVPASVAEARPGGYLVLTDITAQRERTRQLIEERDRLDEFASIVSHDLRNPLEVAKIQLEAAQHRGDDVHFEKVADAHERMERIIGDVLTLARQGQVIDELDDATLSLVAGDAWESVSAPDATLAVDGDLRMKADRDRLQELLENLFRNAVEHGGPEVTVTVGPAEDGFYVADDGPGVPDEDKERVFEGGFSTNDDGTGLGLVIVERIADAHGWSVGVCDAEDGGARFEFSGVRTAD